jgi:3-deoxy-D-manno-octulosonic-acid transferase
VSFSPALALYRAATETLGPFASLWLDARARRGKEDPARLRERFGYSPHPRPAGPLIWLHAASVGESGVALQLVDALTARAPAVSFLLSTGTRTSAELVARRAGANLLHVYAPLDRADAVRRFLAHWRPDLGVFVESELWPHLILESEAAGMKLALVNARMSPRTLARWRKWPAAGARLLRCFDFAAAADARTAEAIGHLRGEDTPLLGNLKLAAAPPRVDPLLRAQLAAEIGARPLWLAASTHAGEDEIVMAAHARLRVDHPDALLIIAPRHPDRGPAIAAIAGGAPRRALAQNIGDASVFIADTMGELGALYDLAPVALIAGSLLPQLKGHNPIEPAKLDAAILSGPYVESFEPVFAALTDAGGAVIVRSEADIAAAVSALWRDASARSAQLAAARAVVEAGAGALDETVSRLLALMPASVKGAAHASA